MLKLKNKPRLLPVANGGSVIPHRSFVGVYFAPHLDEAGRSVARGQPGPAARSTLQLLGHQLRDAGCRVEVEVPEALPKIEGDPGALNQVFLNLLKNAAEANDSKGAGIIRVSAFEEGSEVVVRVEDDGVGMNSEVKSRLFEPFFTTKEAGAGTGLGLSMCRRIVDEHGGQIAFESEPGVGTTMTVRLPRVGGA